MQKLNQSNYSVKWDAKCRTLKTEHWEKSQ